MPPKMVSEATVSAGLLGIGPKATASVKWNVKGGGDRTEQPTIGYIYKLQGQPNIQGVEISNTTAVILYAYSSTNGTGSPELSVPGPTAGQVKNNPVRIGSYRLAPR